MEGERSSTIPTFEQWFHSPNRQDWKLGWWDMEGKASQAAKEKAKEETGASKIFDWMSARRSDYKPGDWFLSFKLGKNVPARMKWMYSQFVVKVSPKDKGAYEKEFPYHVVQIWPNS